MAKALERKLRAARVRCGVNVLLRGAGIALAAAGALAAGAVAIERVFYLPVVTAWSVAGLAAATALVAAWLTARAVPGRMQVAVLIDRRLAARERFSTALAISARPDAFARAASREAHQAAARLDVRRRFPVRPTPHWLATAGAWLIAAGLFAFLPQMDVLGRLTERRATDRRATELAQAKVDVAEATTRVRSAVRQVAGKQLAGDLDDLGELTKALTGADARREAIRKLGALAEKLDGLHDADRARALDELGKALKQLRASPSALDNDLNRALANGNFAGAAKALREIMRKLNDEKLTDEQKKKLADQIKDLSEQLARLGNGAKRSADALRQEGMDAETARKLAGMSAKDLREELKKRGLSDEQIDKLMEKLQAARQACRNCSGLSKSLAKTLGEAGEILPDGLVGLVEALEGMEGEALDRASLEEALQEIDRAIARLGQAEWNGELGDPNNVVWQPGECDDAGQGNAGSGGRGRAWGQRPVGPDHDTSTKQVGVENKPTKDSQIVASWLVKGPQAKGVSKRKVADVARAAKDAAAQAVGDNRIPRKYEGAVKTYFGGFDKTFRPDANQP